MALKGVPMRTDHRFRIAGITKTFTTALVLLPPATIRDATQYDYLTRSRRTKPMGTHSEHNGGAADREGHHVWQPRA